MEVILVRHTKVDVPKGMCYGQSDVPVAHSFPQEAETTKSHLEIYMPFDKVFSSPLSRARLLAAHCGYSDPVIDDRLMEMCFGVYEGVEECFSIPDCPLVPFFKEPQNYTVPVEGAESIEDLFERTGEFLEDKVYPELEKGKDVLIVGHGAMNSTIVSRIRGYERKDFWSAGIENCKLMKLL